MIRTVARLLLPIVVLAGCGAQPHVQVRRLASGEAIKVLGIGKVNRSGAGPTLMLRYQTDLNMDDASAVHAEARRAWAEFRKDAERAKVQRAIVSANSPPSGGGVITHTRTYNFVFERQGEGDWREIQQE